MVSISLMACKLPQHFLNTWSRFLRAPSRDMIVVAIIRPAFTVIYGESSVIKLVVCRVNEAKRAMF